VPSGGHERQVLGCLARRDRVHEERACLHPSAERDLARGQIDRSRRRCETIETQRVREAARDVGRELEHERVIHKGRERERVARL